MRRVGLAVLVTWICAMLTESPALAQAREPTLALVGGNAGVPATRAILDRGGGANAERRSERPSGA